MVCIQRRRRRRSGHCFSLECLRQRSARCALLLRTSSTNALWFASILCFALKQICLWLGSFGRFCYCCWIEDELLWLLWTTLNNKKAAWILCTVSAFQLKIKPRKERWDVQHENVSAAQFNNLRPGWPEVCSPKVCLTSRQFVLFAVNCCVIDCCTFSPSHQLSSMTSRCLAVVANLLVDWLSARDITPVSLSWHKLVPYLLLETSKRAEESWAELRTTNSEELRTGGTINCWATTDRKKKRRKRYCTQSSAMADRHNGSRNWIQQQQQQQRTVSDWRKEKRVSLCVTLLFLFARFSPLLYKRALIQSTCLVQPTKWS